jgi:hypothetical protein
MLVAIVQSRIEATQMGSDTAAAVYKMMKIRCTNENWQKCKPCISLTHNWPARRDTSGDSTGFKFTE